MRPFIYIVMVLCAASAMADILPMDAIVFRADKNESDSLVGRIDLMAALPFQFLRFSDRKGAYESDFQAIVRISNEKGEKIIEEVFSLSAKAKDYYTAQGGTGAFYPFIKRFDVPASKYKVELSLLDEGGKYISFAQKEVSVVNFPKYRQTVSGLMLISSIMEVDGKMKITPHLSDNIYDLDDGFSVFFQVYSDIEQELFIDWEMVDSKDETIKQGELGTVALKEGESQHRIYINDLEGLPLEEMLLKVYLRETGPGNNILAAADRSVNNIPSSGGELLKNIDEAIDMLAYVADASVIDSIQNLPTERDKRRAFLEFWDGLDPSPNTKRNEAFEEYFERIEYANKQFNTYAAGWLTDMGRIYIVLGPPDDISQSTPMNSRGLQEIWMYNQIGRFWFQDRSGFGDYRLVQPISFRRKYEYGSRTGR